MAEYAFQTTWVLEAPIERVWAALRDSGSWRDWFPALRGVELVDPGDADGVGAVLEATIQAPLPYALRFRARITRVEPPRLLELTALGDLEGTGRGTLAEEGGITTLRFDWRVATTKAWMNAVAPIGRPVFGWSHGAVMTRAGRGLAAHLGARLLANESGPIERDVRGTATAAAVIGAVLLTGAAVVVGRRSRRG